MSHHAEHSDPDLKAMEKGEKLSCLQGCCKCMGLAKMGQKKIKDRKRSVITSSTVTTKPWIGGRIDIKTSCRKQMAASPRSAKVRESILSTEILVKHFMRTSGLSEEAKMLRESCYRFKEVIQMDEPSKRKYYEQKKASDLDNTFAISDARGLRGKWIMQALIAVNVLHGLVQLVLGVYTWDDYCDYPFSELLVTCGVPNICMVVVYSLIFFSQEELFPVDEDDDEEMGWPLYVAGFVIWICWILDFSAWLILCLVYKKSKYCESTLEDSAFSTVIIRATLIFVQLFLIVWHLKSKIRDENKRKLGHNPIRSIFKRKAKYLGEDDDPEVMEAINLWERQGKPMEFTI